MKICYLILAHKNPIQINMLLNELLKDHEAVVYLHISKPQFDTIASDIINDDRVHLIKPVKVEWGGHDILKVQLLLLKAAINENADYYQYITGQDFPIRNGLKEYLESNKGTVFVENIESPIEEKVRLEFVWPHVLRKLYNDKLNLFRIIRKLRIVLLSHGFPGIRKRLPKQFANLKYYKSMFWVTIDKEVALYIVFFVKNNPEVLALYKNAINAEEGFWATLIRNSNQLSQKKLSGDTLVYTGNFVNNHPSVLTIDNIKELNESGAFFARKFDIEIDNEVIEYYMTRKA